MIVMILIFSQQDSGNYVEEKTDYGHQPYVTIDVNYFKCEQKKKENSIW